MQFPGSTPQSLSIKEHLLHNEFRDLNEPASRPLQQVHNHDVDDTIIGAIPTWLLWAAGQNCGKAVFVD
jgi:hypothetical protein